MAENGNASVDCQAVGTSEALSEDSVAVSSLSWGFQGSEPVLHDFSLHLPGGSRCLLLGANGAGQSHPGDIDCSLAHLIHWTCDCQLSTAWPEMYFELAGKTTLLQILAGKHMVGQDVVRIIGRSAFHDIVGPTRPISQTAAIC